MIRAMVLLLALTVSGQADTLTFRNGAMVTGTWLGIDGGQIKFEVNDQLQVYPRSDVSAVTFGEPAPQNPLPPIPPPPPPPPDVSPGAPVGSNVQEPEAQIQQASEVQQAQPAKQTPGSIISVLMKNDAATNKAFSDSKDDFFAPNPKPGIGTFGPKIRWEKTPDSKNPGQLQASLATLLDDGNWNPIGTYLGHTGKDGSEVGYGKNEKGYAYEIFKKPPPEKKRKGPFSRMLDAGGVMGAVAVVTRNVGLGDLSQKTSDTGEIGAKVDGESKGHEPGGAFDSGEYVLKTIRADDVPKLGLNTKELVFSQAQATTQGASSSTMPPSPQQR
jgi:hypothetical protein